MPSLGLLTVNAMTAADSILIPIQCEIYALEGLQKLKNTITLVKDNLNPNLKIEGIVMTMYDSRLRLANMILEEVRRNITDPVYQTIIHRNSKISESPSMKKPVIMYDAASTGSMNFLQLAMEFLKRNEESRTNDSTLLSEEKVTSFEELNPFHKLGTSKKSEES
jgi:chromosome partitioning protein